MSYEGGGGDDFGGFNYSFSPSFSNDSGGFTGSTSFGSSGGYSQLSSGDGGGFSGGGGTENALSSFAPSPGIDLGSAAFPDPTSVGYSGENTFGERFAAADDAVRSGEFNPIGENYAPPGLGGGTGGGGVGSDYAASGGVGGGMIPSASAPDLNGMDFSSAYNSAIPQGGGAPGGGAPGLPGVGDRGPSLPQPGSPAASGGGGTFLEKLTAGAGASLAKNPLGILAAGAGLGLNMLKGNKDPEGLDAIRAGAESLKSTGSVLQSYLQTGTLPPGMQASVDLATKAAKARIIQNHANRGLSADPTKNSALQQELSQLDQNAIITAATIGDKLMTQGLSATGMANQLYQSLINLDRERSKATGAAIANFASALGGGSGTTSGGGINLKIG